MMYSYKIALHWIMQCITRDITETLFFGKMEQCNNLKLYYNNLFMVDAAKTLLGTFK